MENVNQLQLVSYETAKKLKEVGFDWRCNIGYSFEGKLVESSYLNSKIKDKIFLFNNSDNKNAYSAPPLALVQKWLREVHNIIIISYPSLEFYNVTDDISDDFWNYQIWNTYENISIEDNSFKTYEEALSAGIIEALKLIE